MQKRYICNMVAIISAGKQQWLRNSISLMLVLLFTLGITPKKILHDLLVDHQDEIACFQHEQKALVFKAGFHCDTDNLVAESPFTGEEIPTVQSPYPVFIQFDDAVETSLHAVTTIYCTLRGPPASV